MRKTVAEGSVRGWQLAGIALLAGVALAGCGSGGGSSTTNVRLANATLSHPAINLVVNANATPTVSLTALDAISAYAQPASGSVTLQVNDSTAGSSLTTTVPTLASGQHYTVLAYESGGTVKTAILNEDFALPTAASSSQIRIYDAAPEAGKLDVYITEPTADLNTASPLSFTNVNSPTSSSLVTQTAGTYRVRVTGYQNKSDLRLDIPAVVLAAQQIATVVLTPTTGGQLLNAATVIQQGAYTGTRNTNARVRLAAAVTGVTVAADAVAPVGTTPIDVGSVSPAFGYYVLVPANSALNVRVNNASIAAPAATLTAGGDATLLVYGNNAGSAVATLLTDDNRVPSDGISVKLRLINGITGSVGALTLAANNNLVGNGIAPGAASDYATVPVTYNPVQLNFNAALKPNLFATAPTSVFSVNSVYTILAGGDVGAPQLTIR